MKLIFRIIIRLSFWLTLILSLWAVLFYLTILDEINDEVDDSLEDYSEQIITRQLAGEILPFEDNASNNQFFLKEISEKEASSVSHLRYVDSMVYIHAKHESEPARVLFTIFENQEGQFYELMVCTPTIEKDDLQEAIFYWLVFLYITLLILIIIVCVLVFYRNMRPLRVILTWLDNYKLGKQNVQLQNKTDITEFQKLNESVVKSIQRAEIAFEKQKQFIGNASHEIQTPIAICLNRIEMLMDNDDFAEYQLMELSKIHETLQYIVKLNKSLLLLTKIDNNQFSDQQQVKCNNLLHRLVQNYEEVYSYKHITVDITETHDLVIFIDKYLIEILLNNLIKNAFVHSPENSLIEIEVNSTSFVIKNLSKDGVSLDTENIFTRFYHNSRKKESTGLGLPIIKSICDITNISINYSYSCQKHCFALNSRKN